MRTNESPITVNISAEYLPGLVYALRWHLGMWGEDLDSSVSPVDLDPDEVAPYRMCPAAKVRANATRVRQLIEVLDAIGWQTTHDVTLTLPVDTLAFVFVSLAEHAEETLDDIATDEDSWNYAERQQAISLDQLAASEQVLAQVTA